MTEAMLETIRRIERLRMLGQTIAAADELAKLATSSHALASNLEYASTFWLLGLELAALDRNMDRLVELLARIPDDPGYAAIGGLFGAYFLPSQYQRAANMTAFVELAAAMPRAARELGGLYAAKNLNDIGDLDGARAWCVDSMSRARERFDDTRLAVVAATAGEIEFRAGNPRGALELFDLAASLQPPVSEIHARLLVFTGITLMALGAVTEAESCFHESFQRSRLQGQSSDWAFRGLMWCLAWRAGSSESTRVESIRARSEYHARRSTAGTGGRPAALLTLTDAYLARIDGNDQLEETLLHQAANGLAETGDILGAAWCHRQAPPPLPDWTALSQPHDLRCDACDEWLLSAARPDPLERQQAAWRAWERGQPDWMTLFF